MRYLPTILAASFAALSASPAFAQGVPSDDATLRSGPEIGFDASDDDFLAGGGGIDTQPGLSVSSESEEFLEDGGGIESRPDILSTSESEEFLEDGGSVRTVAPATPALVSAPAVRPRPARTARTVPSTPARAVAAAPAPAWRDAPRPRMSFVTRGSLTVATTDVGVERQAERRRRYGMTAGAHDALSDNEGPRIIDVETARLDRRPFPDSGIDVIHRPGGPKIIRIAPTFKR